MPKRVPAKEIRKLVAYRKKLDEQVAKLKKDYGVTDGYLRGCMAKEFRL